MSTPYEREPEPCPQIVSTPDTCGGSPRVAGTRMTCANVIGNRTRLSAEEWRRVYGHLDDETVRQVLVYCAGQRCRTAALRFCQQCSLAPCDDEDDPDLPHDPPEDIDYFVIARQLLIAMRTDSDSGPDNVAGPPAT